MKNRGFWAGASVLVSLALGAVVLSFLLDRPHPSDKRTPIKTPDHRLPAKSKTAAPPKPTAPGVRALRLPPPPAPPRAKVVKASVSPVPPPAPPEVRPRPKTRPKLKTKVNPAPKPMPRPAPVKAAKPRPRVAAPVRAKTPVKPPPPLAKSTEPPPAPPPLIARRREVAKPPVPLRRILPASKPRAKPQARAAARPRPAPSPPKTERPKMPASKTPVVPTRATRREGRTLLRLLEYGKGPSIEIAWPEAAGSRDRLYRQFRTCFGMRNAVMTAAGKLFGESGPPGAPWNLNLDRYSGFVRHPAGSEIPAERDRERAIAARHGVEGRLVRVFPRNVDAALLGGLNQVVGGAYGDARSITARYRRRQGRLVLDAIRVNGRALTGAVDVGAAARRGCVL